MRPNAPGSSAHGLVLNALAVESGVAHEGARGVALIHRGEPRAVRLGDEVARLAHLQRIEDVLADVAAERLTGDALDERGLHVHRDAVRPARAGLGRERDARELLRELR